MALIPHGRHSLRWKLNFLCCSFSELRGSARNIFIATLALADLQLCLFTMPMTLAGILTKYWPFGPESWFLCKLVQTVQAVTVFFSSFTIAVIAADRYQFIVRPEGTQVRRSWWKIPFFLFYSQLDNSKYYSNVLKPCVRERGESNSDVIILFQNAVQVSPTGAVIISSGILVLSVGLATPIFVYARLQKIFTDPGDFDHVAFCLEGFSLTWKVM